MGRGRVGLGERGCRSLHVTQAPGDIRTQYEEAQPLHGCGALVLETQHPVDDLRGGRRILLRVREEGRVVQGPREGLLGRGPVVLVLTRRLPDPDAVAARVGHQELPYPAAVSEHASPPAALRRSWALTRGSLRRTYGVCLLITVTVVLGFTLLRYAVTPLAHPAGLAMLWISGDNVYVTGVLVLITPTVVALLLLPLVITPPVCSVVTLLHAELRLNSASWKPS